MSQASCKHCNGTNVKRELFITPLSVLGCNDCGHFIVVDPYGKNVAEATQEERGLYARAILLGRMLGDAAARLADKALLEVMQ